MADFSFTAPQSPGSMAGAFAAAPSAQARGTKRGAPLTAEEGLKRVKRAVGWYNHNGGLQQPVIYKAVKAQLEAIRPTDALKILKGLDEKGPEIRNPTAWVKAAAENCGPEPDIKVRKTIAWFNKHGNLQSPIKYDDVKSVLGSLPVVEACAILKDLEPKAAEVREPTAWIYKAAARKLEQWKGVPQTSHSPQAPSQSGAWGPGRGSTGQAASKGSAGGGKGFGGSAGGLSFGGAPRRAPPSAGGNGDASSVERKIRTTIAWYNKHGGLCQPIVFDEVSACLSQMDVEGALKILKGLDDKGWSIKNPTAWVLKAAQNALGLLP